MNKSDLEMESGATLAEAHQCDANELPEYLRLYRVEAIEGKPLDHWELFTLWLANGDDVMAGEAEEEGELLNLSSIKVRYCPFCGEELS